MITVKQSTYEPSPLFIAANPRFVSRVAVRLFFMEGLGKLMNEEERLAVAKQTIVDCMKDSNPPVSPLDLLSKMLYIGTTNERGTK
jgi:surface polysaccharide O-acyltransferase-like enzyme